KAVMEVRERRLQGSEAILWDALEAPKFWTRMFAAIGLAEFNFEVSVSQLEGVLRRERSELIANFFERFVRQNTPAERFVMRQMIRLLDERGRLVVLRALQAGRDDLRSLYLIAAT